MSYLTIKTLDKVVDWIVNESCEDTCQICAYYEDFSCVDDDIEPCPYKRNNGKKACRTGIISYFMGRVDK